MRIGKCPMCRRVKELTKHHKDFNPLNDVPSNRQYICRDCHDLVHGIKKKWKPNKKYQPGTLRTKRKCL
jgi:uncharacterized protein YlaI